MDWLHSSIPVPYGLTFIATIALAFALGHLSNIYLWVRKKVKAPDDKRRVSVWAFWRCMPEHITAMDELLRRAVFADSLVLLCLKSRKVYCGVVSETRGNHESSIAHVQIIPAFSITRNKDTLQFEKGTKTEYKAYYLKKAFERKETLNQMIEDSAFLLEIIEKRLQQMVRNDRKLNRDLLVTLRETIQQQKTERQQIEKDLEPYSQRGSFDLSDWVKIIPVSEIESASLYKDEDYGKWFSDTSYTPAQNTRYVSSLTQRAAGSSTTRTWSQSDR
jgi:hypothetical protein